jgi:molecular chaperone HtpG
LGDRVESVRTTHRLSDSPARLVDPEGAPEQSVQRVYRMMDKNFEIPKKVLELNPNHKIILGLTKLPEGDPRFNLVAEQIYENTLLIEGLHPDPVSMVGRIQDLIAKTLDED